jgi:protein-L-isoaspartate O-methyltransferase
MPSLCTLRRTFVCLLLFLCKSVAAADVERTGGPYVPTPQMVVDAMLDLAKVGPRDFVVDLGSGDGRIVLTAAQRFSARGLGIDIDPELIQQSNAEAQRRGLADRVSFKEQDVLQAHIEDATVLTLYLLPGMMQSLQEKFIRELKPGTRIVSHDFPFGDWKPDREVSIDIPEKYGTPGRWKSTLFYWVVPAQVQGMWLVDLSGVPDQTVPVTFTQRYQYVEGSAMARGKRIPIADGKVDAHRVRFKLALNGSVYEFQGTVEGDDMRGQATQGDRTVHWTAVRVKAAKAAGG